MKCSKCGGETSTYANGKRCRPCYNEYMRIYMAKRYAERKAQTVLVLGGKCVDCGSTERLEIDHILRSTKVLDVSSRTWSSKVYWAEVIEKCTLRCNTCHRRKTAREFSVEHGGGMSGKRNCYCEPCKARKREYMKNYTRSRTIVANGPDS
jgi:hypothetical protein